LNKTTVIFAVLTEASDRKAKQKRNKILHQKKPADFHSNRTVLDLTNFNKHVIFPLLAAAQIKFTH